MTYPTGTVTGVVEPGSILSIDGTAERDVYVHLPASNYSSSERVLFHGFAYGKPDSETGRFSIEVPATVVYDEPAPYRVMAGSRTLAVVESLAEGETVDVGVLDPSVSL
jgi:hypothetical protein